MQVHPGQQLLGASPPKEDKAGEQRAAGYYAVSTSTKGSDGLFEKCSFKIFNAAQHAYINRTGLRTQRAYSQSDTQLSVQRHFSSNAVHSDLLGSFID